MKKIYILIIISIVFFNTLHATSFVVSNTNDAGAGSLRQCMLDANSDNTATSSLPHLLNFSNAVLNNEIVLVTALPVINNHIVINGTSIMKITATTGMRVFAINDGYTVAINSFTLQKGSISTGHGGCIYNAGTLTLNNMIVDANNVTGAGYNGGGIYNDINSSLTISNSWIINNKASTTETNSGGGIYSASGSWLTITNSTIGANWASSGGGGITNEGKATFTNVTFDNNWGNTGGGLCNHASSILTNTTFFNTNQAQNGGAIATSGYLSIVNSTITNNDIGGGIYIIGNPSVSLLNTLCLGNYNQYDIYANGDVTIVADYCLFGSKELGITLSGSNNSIDIEFNDVFGYNDNFNNSITETISLKQDSPAINAGTSIGAPLTDQSGQNRVESTDIGAFEYQSLTTAITNKQIQNAIKVYSNPGHGVFQVEIGSAVKGMYDWKVIDNIGRTVQSSVPQNKISDVQFQIVNLSEQKAGTYFLIFNTTDNVITKQVIKI